MKKRLFLAALMCSIVFGVSAFAEESQTEGRDAILEEIVNPTIPEIFDSYLADSAAIPLEEYIENGEWFLTGKKEYEIQAMMASKETEFWNELEQNHFVVMDDGETVVLKGTVGELWPSRLTRVEETYTKAEGERLTADDFEKKDVYINIRSIPSLDSYYEMFVPASISVTVETEWGDDLHANAQPAPHGEGDFLVCRKGENGDPDLSDVWVVNGLVFPNTYDTSHMPEEDLGKKIERETDEY